MLLRNLQWFVFGILVVIKIDIIGLLKREVFPSSINLGVLWNILILIWAFLMAIGYGVTFISKIDEEWGVGMVSPSNIPYFHRFHEDPVHVFVKFTAVGKKNKGYRIDYMLDGSNDPLWIKGDQTRGTLTILKTLLAGSTVQRIRGIKVITDPSRIFYPSSLDIDQIENAWC